MRRYASFWNKKFFLLLAILILVLIFAAIALDVYIQSLRMEIKPADAIVVLGARQSGGQPLPVFKARLDRAHELYKSGLAPIIILTGGVGSGENISEAKTGENYLVAKKVSASAIMIETTSRTSWQSLNNILPIIKENNIQSTILVSDDFHNKRLRKMASNLSFNVLVAPIINGPIQQNPITKIKYILRESWVYILYLVFKI